MTEAKPTKIDAALLAAGWVPLRWAALKMGCSLSSVYRLVDAGKLEAQVSAGKKYVSIQSCTKYLGPDAAKALGLTPKGRPKTAEPAVADD